MEDRLVEGATKNAELLALMQAAQAQAQRDGMVRLELSTAKTNAPAQALYESLGWVRDEEFFTYRLDIPAGGFR